MHFLSAAPAPLSIIAKEFKNRPSAVRPSLKKGESRFHFIKRIIQEYKISSVESLLIRLPNSFFDFFAVPFDTRSNQQQASADLPRILVLSNQGKFTFTFNGGKGVGAESFEMIEFNEKQNRFDFRSIDFSKATPAINSSLTSCPGFINSKPTPCSSCHRGHPIWDDYPMWRGVLGQSDDFFTLQVSDVQLAKLLTNEQKVLDRFLELAKTHPRYQHLPTHLLASAGKTDLNLAGSLQGFAQMNTFISFYYEALNRKRILQNLRNQPSYLKSRDVLLGITGFKMDEFQMRKLYPQLNWDGAQNELTDLIRDTHNRLIRHRNAKLRSVFGFLERDPTKDLPYPFSWKRAYHPEFSRTFAADRVEVIARLRLAMRRLNLGELFNWSLSLEPETFTLQDGLSGGVGDLLRDIQAEMKNQFPSTIPDWRDTFLRTPTNSDLKFLRKLHIENTKTESLREKQGKVCRRVLAATKRK